MTAYGLFFCFFFKQKTAYDMRISDWSSDVCSSDLRKGIHADREKIDEAAAVDGGSVRRGQCHIVGARVARLAGRAAGGGGGSGGCGRVQHDLGELRGNAALDDQAGRASQRVARSEEHTSELQSLMRNSYAVFCLTKKTILIQIPIPKITENANTSSKQHYR